MKPLRFESIVLKHPPIKEAIERAHGLRMGEIDSESIDTSLWDPAPFFWALHDRNYRRRDCRKYHSLTLTYVDGSVPWHNDPGFGVVACWLVYSENSSCYDAQLITAHGALDLRENDLCIFNADQGHAWISDGACVMVMATVAPIKGKRPRLSLQDRNDL